MSMRDRMKTSVFSLRRSAIREFSALAASVPGCIRLTLGEPDFATPDNICREAVRSIENSETHYIENNGAAALREKISEFERKGHGLDYSKDEIIVTAGATEALFVALTGILDPGDEVIIPQPAFVLYEEIVKLCGAVPVHLDTRADSFMIRRDKLLPLVTEKTKAIIVNSPNNPTGCVYDEESLLAVREAATEGDIFVICDDVYRELYYGDDYHSFAMYTGLRDRIIEVQSFSKPYAMTGWRLGYLMADYPVKERLELVHQFAVVSTPSMFQTACIEALDTDPSAMREEYRARRDYVTERLRGFGMDVVIPDGAFYVFPSIRKFGLSSSEFAKRLITEAGVAVTPGFAFGSDEHIRISYACSMDELREGFDRIENFISRGTLNELYQDAGLRQ